MQNTNPNTNTNLGEYPSSPFCSPDTGAHVKVSNTEVRFVREHIYVVKVSDNRKELLPYVRKGYFHTNATSQFSPLSRQEKNCTPLDVSFFHL